VNKNQKKFFKLVEEERERQDTLWGKQSHSDQIWVGIILSELGDLAKSLLREDEEGIDKELVHLTAVMTAMWECRREELYSE
jgi:hypothetical protein